MQTETRIAVLTQVRGILNALLTLAGHLRIYEPKNQVVTLALAKVMQQLGQHFASGEEFRLVISRHGVLFDGDFVDRSNAHFQKFANNLFMHGVAAVTIKSDVTGYELVTFLRLAGRKPAESWDEGGLCGALADRQISGIVVQELSEDDFHLLGAGERTAGTVTVAEAGGGDLWDRFALLIAGQQPGTGSAGEAGNDPLALASRSSSFLATGSLEEKQRFVRQLADFLTALQQENVRIYRTEALTKLTTFVSNLSPDLRQLFLQNAFNLNLSGDFAEGFFSGLSDDTILDALHNASFGKSYVPPVVLSLLGRLAANRGIGGDLAAQLPAADGETLAREMFRPDEFAKYVPESYRNTLLALVRSERLDAGMRSRIDLEKGSLQPDRLETHCAEIILYFIGHDIDERHLDGVIGSLDSMIDTYSMRGEYRAILQLYQACLLRGTIFYQKISHILHAPEYIAMLLDGPRRHGKERFEELKELIVAIGFPCIDPLLDRLGEENNRAIRHFYVECLKGLGQPVLGLVAPRLNDQRWFFLRNLLYLLRELGDPTFALKVRPLFTHPHPKVRAEALRTGLYFRDAVAQRILMDQLGSRDEAVLLQAVGLARLSRDNKVVERLLSLLRKGFFDYRYDLKVAIVHSLSESGAPQALPTFVELLRSRRWLYGAAHEDLKLEIVRALERYPLEQVREPLRRLTEQPESDLGRLAADVLGRLEGRQG